MGILSGRFDPSRTTSSTTRIETIYLFSLMIILLQLPELHPAQQGLKRESSLAYVPATLSSRTTSSTTRIETHYYADGRTYYGTSRTTSSTTRIETTRKSCSVLLLPTSRTTSSTTRIETNSYKGKGMNWEITSRTTSSTTRIETWVWRKDVLEAGYLPELHPAQQGLKRHMEQSGC